MRLIDTAGSYWTDIYQSLVPAAILAAKEVSFVVWRHRAVARDPA